MRNVFLIPTLLAAALAAGCVSVKITDEDTPRTSFYCTFDVPDGGGDAGAPSEWTFVSARRRVAVHNVFNFHEGDRDVVIKSPAGEYSAMAFGYLPEGNCNLENGDDFLEDTSFPVSDLWVALRQLSTAELERDFAGHEWIDGSMPVVTDAGRLLTAKSEYTITMEDVEKEVNFKLQDRTIKIRAAVNIKVQGDARIDSVMACISGVPKRLQLVSGWVGNDYENLGQCTFRMKRPATNGADTGQDNGAGVYSGEISALGLFPSDNPDYRTGPGVLFVAVFASIEKEQAGLQPANPDDEGRIHKKYAFSYNLKKKIPAGIMEKTTEEGFRKLSGKKTVYDLGQLATYTVKIDVEASGGDGSSDTQEEWIIDDQNIVDENGEPIQI